MDTARQYEQSALDLVQNLNQSPIIIEALTNLAHAVYLQDDHQTAYDLYRQALETARRSGNTPEVADILRRLAFVSEALGHDVQEMLEESLSISRHIGDYPGIARSSIQLGEVYQEKGVYARAKAHYDQALKIVEEIEDEALISLAWQQLGELAQQQEDWSEAQRCYQQSLIFSRLLGNRDTLALLLHQLGQVLYRQNQLAVARQALEESLQLSAELGNREGLVGTLHQLAWVSAEEGNIGEARRLCAQSITILEEIGSPYLEIARASLAEFEQAVKDGEH